MAKYTVMMSCGHEETVQLFGKNSERERKIEYYKSSGLCKECYKKMKQAEAEKEGLVFNASILPQIDDETGDIMVSVWFSGDTMPHKDEIKAIGGYRWSEREAADDFFSLKRPVMCWNKQVALNDLVPEAEKAEAIGAAKFDADEGFFFTINYQIALKHRQEWMENQQKNAELQKKINEIIKPEAPEILKGHRWNGKIYGKEGNHSIYLDGGKVTLSDEEAEAISAYLAEKAEYDKKVEEIKKC